MHEEEEALRMVTKIGEVVVRGGTQAAKEMARFAQEVIARYMAKRANMNEAERMKELLNKNPMEALVQQGVDVAIDIMPEEETATKLITMCNEYSIPLYIQKNKSDITLENEVIIVHDKSYEGLVRVFKERLGIAEMCEEYMKMKFNKQMETSQDKESKTEETSQDKESKTEETEAAKEQEKKTSDKESPIKDKEVEKEAPAPANFPPSLNEEAATRSETQSPHLEEKQSPMEIMILGFQKESVISTSDQEKQESEIQFNTSETKQNPERNDLILENLSELNQNDEKKKRSIKNMVNAARQEKQKADEAKNTITKTKETAIVKQAGTII